MTIEESKATKQYIELLEKKIEKLQEQLKYYHEATDFSISGEYHCKMSISDVFTDKTEKEYALRHAKIHISENILNEIKSRIVFKIERSKICTQVVGTLFINNKNKGRI